MAYTNATRKDTTENLYIHFDSAKVYIENARVTWLDGNVDAISWTEKNGVFYILKMFSPSEIFPKGWWAISRDCSECGNISCKNAGRETHHTSPPKITIVNNIQ